jgi:hypothetical protein
MYFKSQEGHTTNANNIMALDWRVGCNESLGSLWGAILIYRLHRKCKKGIGAKTLFPGCEILQRTLKASNDGAQLIHYH